MLEFKGIGMTCHGPSLEGNLERFEARLNDFRNIGVDYVELPSHGLDIILNGKFNSFRLDKALKILKKFDFNYAVHPFNDLNLFDTEELNKQREIFLRNLEFTSMVGAEVLVYHAGVRLPQDEHRSMEELMEIEREELYRLGQKAKELGVNIAVENSNPTLRDVQSDQIHNYGMFLDQLYEQVSHVNHQNVGICLDYGHAYLSASYHGFDFVSSVRQIMPLVNHLHVHDNFGIVSKTERSYLDQYHHGEGDLHLPVGWGSIPYNELFQMESKPVICLVELKPRYEQDMVWCVDSIKKLLNIKE